MKWLIFEVWKKLKIWFNNTVKKNWNNADNIIILMKLEIEFENNRKWNNFMVLTYDNKLILSHELDSKKTNLRYKI